MPVLVAEGWSATGLLAGFGEHPTRRLLIGVLLSAILAIVWLAGRRGERWMLSSPTGSVMLAVAAATAVGFDGGYRSPWFGTSVAASGLTVAAGFPRWAMPSALIGIFGSVGGYFAAAGSIDALSDRGELTTFIAAILGYAVAVVALVTLLEAFARFVRQADQAILVFRNEAHADRAALLVPGPLTTSGQVVPPALPRADPSALVARLTPAELRVVERLASGLLAKQIAVGAGVSVLTVRTQIKHAKRKTGARTLAELVAIVRAADTCGQR